MSNPFLAAVNKYKLIEKMIPLPLRFLAEQIRFHFFICFVL